MNVASLVWKGVGGEECNGEVGDYRPRWTLWELHQCCITPRSNLPAVNPQKGVLVPEGMCSREVTYWGDYFGHIQAWGDEGKPGSPGCGGEAEGRYESLEQEAEGHRKLAGPDQGFWG